MNGSADEAFDRVYKAARKLFEPVDPQGPPVVAPPELQQWAFNTSVLSIATGSFAAFGEYARQKREPLRVPKHLPPALHDMYLRNQQGARAVKLANRGLWGGVYALLFGSLFYGIEGVAAIARDKQDAYNTVVGGLSTGLLFGGMLPGTATFRASRAVLGALCGAAVGGLTGYLSHDVVSSLESDASRRGDS